MAMRAKPSTPSETQTIFAIPSIHCPTCAAFIDDFLFRLRPKPISVATSIVSHSVIVRHHVSLTVRMIVTALDEADYEVESVITDPVRDAPLPTHWRSAADDFPFVWHQRTSEHLSRRKKASDEETKRRRHVQHCELCRARQLKDEFADRDREHSFGEFSNNQNVDGFSVVVDGSSSPPDNVFQASISITGMSCSSCVGKVTAALEEMPWAKSANVALITQSASVEFEGEVNALNLVKIIGWIGYEASLEHVSKLPARADKVPSIRRNVHMYKKRGARH